MITVNMLIKWINEEGSAIERVLWFSKLDNVAFAIDVDSDKYPYARTVEELELGLKNGDACVVEDDPFYRIVHEEEISEKDKTMREQAWNAIKSIVDKEPAIYNPKERAKMIAEGAGSTGLSRKSFSKYLKRYWQRGKTKNALLPDFYLCGGRGKVKAVGTAKKGRPRKNQEIVGTGINVNDEIKRIFRIAINRFYLNSSKPSLMMAYQMMRREFFAEDYKIKDNVKIPILKPSSEVPSYTQFYYFYKSERSIKKEVTARHSAKKYQQQNRAVIGDSTSESLGPGSIYQIDATVADVYLVSRFNRSWIIGRPVVYAVIDVFSRMVAGIYVGLEGPSYIGSMMALANAFCEKTSFCKSFGIDIQEEDWPVHYVPESVMADRGELEGKAIENLINGLHVKILNAPPYRADWKGVIEQHFRTVNLQFKPLLPGVISADSRERGERDRRLDAKLDIYQFTQIIIKCALYHNNQHYLKNYMREEMMIEDDVECIPRVLWNWGLVNRAGKLKSVPEDIVKLHLMPTDTATVSYKGIRFKNLYYASPLILKLKWLEQAREKGSWTINVSYDPRNMNFIYIKDMGNKGFEKCYLLDHQARYKDKTFEEIQCLLEEERQHMAKVSDSELQAKIDLVTEIENIAKQAEAKNRIERVNEESNTKRKKGIRIKRKFEKEMNSVDEGFELDKYEVKEPQQVITLSATRGYEPEEINQLDLLRRKQKEAFKKIYDKDTNS